MGTAGGLAGGRVSVSDLDDDLRATAESIAGDAERLKQIERAKALLPADDPRVAQLARQAELLIDEMASKATEQSLLVDEAGSGA